MSNRIDNTLQLWVPRLIGNSSNIERDWSMIEDLSENIGDFKPGKGAKWTSTAYPSKSNPGTWQSEWSEWTKDQMPEWSQKRGILFKVKPGARILELDTDKQALAVARKYGMNVSKSMDLFFRGMPWEKIKQDYDAVHHIPSGRYENTFMSSWDVESTAWFNTSYLEKKEIVNIDTGDVDAEQMVKKSQDEWSEKFLKPKKK